MLFLRDRGEGRVNPTMAASLKEEIPSFHCGHLSIRPRRPSPSTRLFTPGEGFFSLVTVNNTRSTPAPAYRLQQKITPLPAPAVRLFLQSLSPNPLSFCVAVIYSNSISRSSSSSSFLAEILYPPTTTHHPPIIFQALS